MITQVDWSLPLFRFRGIAVRADWTLFLIIIYDVATALRQGAPWWFALAIVIGLFGSILLHEFGHALVARAVGGSSHRIVLWMLGGLAECQVPPRAGAHFLVAAAGPAVTGIIAGAAYSLERATDVAAVSAIAGYLTSLNLRLLLFNLVPCFPLDGGRMSGSALWAFLGAHRAQRITMFLSYPSVALLFAWAVWSNSFFGLFICMWLISSLLVEHARLRSGDTSAFGIEAWGEARTSRGWFQGWRQRRQQRAAERMEIEDSADQDVLDRLLEKVSAHGLPSLTAAERSQLERISKRERSRNQL